MDQTREAGLARPNTSGTLQKRYILEANGNGAAFFDYDGDGRLDLYVVNGSTFEQYQDRSGPGNALYHNQGDGRFKEVEAGVKNGGWGAGCAVGDVDNDGHPDLYVTNYGPNSLYRNNGDGTFSDLTGKAGVAGNEYSASAAFFDGDKDGDLDLYVANYVAFDIGSVPPDPALDEPCVYLGGLRVYCGPQGMEGAPDALYRNDGDWRFADITASAGISAAGEYYGLGVVPEDFDEDGDVDIFVANDETPNALFRNEGNGRFTEVGVLAGVAYSGEGKTQAGMGADAGDYDNDGDVDLYVTNFFRESNTLYRNEGNGRFADFTAAAGLAAPTLNFLGWGTKFFDCDDDGDLDLFAANGHVYPQVDQSATGTTYAQVNQLFANVGQGRFVEVEAGPGMQQARVSRGAAVGDCDDDGDVDVFVINLDDIPTLLRNDGGEQNHYLQVQVEGTRINRDGVGTRVRVRTAAGEQQRTISGAGSYLSHSDLRAHFGLGRAEQAEVEILWPDSTSMAIQGVPADRLLFVRQGQGYQVWDLGRR